MNIDERFEKLGLFIEKLGEKHEGLSQSVELLVSMHKDHEREFAEHKRLVTGAIESIAQTNRQLTQMLAAMHDDQVRMHDEQVRMRSEQQQDRGEFRDAMMRLSVIAEAHQDTLDDHEKRLGRPAA